MKKLITRGIFALLVLGGLAHLGHIFGVYDLTKAYEIINLKAGEFGLITLLPIVLALVGKVIAEFVKDMLTYKNDNEEYLTNQKIDSDNKLMEQNEIAINQNEIIIELLTNQAEYQYNKDEVIANMSFVPADLKQSILDVKAEAETKLVETTETVLEEVLDMSETILDKVVDKGLDFLQDKAEDLIGKL